MTTDPYEAMATLVAQIRDDQPGGWMMDVLTSPDDLLAIDAELKALRRALTALTAGYPGTESGPDPDWEDYVCFWCRGRFSSSQAYDADHPNFDQPALDHADGCPWVAARALLDERKPEPGEVAP